MTRLRTLPLSLIFLVGLVLAAQIPAVAGVSGSGLIITGKIHTVDLDARIIRIRQADGGGDVLSVPVSAMIRRNRAAATLSGLVLGDSFVALRDPRTGGLVYLTALGTDVSQNDGKLMDVATLTGDIQVGTAVFKTGSETKIVRNGAWASLNHLTLRDNVVVHARSGSNMAVDMIGQGPTVKETEGTIGSIHAAEKTLMLDPENGTPSLVLTVDAAAMVEKSGGVVALGDLKSGDPATIVYNPDARVAYCIGGGTAGEIRGVTGTVSAVNTAAGTLTIAPSDGGDALTLTVNAATEIEVNGVHAALAGVTAGLPVWAKYNILTKVAVKIEAGDREDPDDDYVAVKGSVGAVGTTSITVKPEDGSAPVVLTVDAATRIRINRWPGSLGDIEAGDSIMAIYDPKTMIAFKLMVKNEDIVEVRGRVDTVGASSVSILPNGSDPLVTLTVNASTEVLLDGKPATLAQVSVGDFAWGVYDRTTMVAAKLWFRTAPEHKHETIDGTVSAVGASSVTILPKTGGSAVTLKVDASTEIKINGHPGTLAEVSINDDAWAFYDPATKIAAKLWIKTETRKKWETIAGSVSALGASSVTITPSSGAMAVTLTVDASTQIKIDGKPGNFQGIKVGYLIEAKYEKTTLVATHLVVKTK